MGVNEAALTLPLDSLETTDLTSAAILLAVSCADLKNCVAVALAPCAENTLSRPVLALFSNESTVKYRWATDLAQHWPTADLVSIG